MGAAPRSRFETPLAAAAAPHSAQCRDVPHLEDCEQPVDLAAPKRLAAAFAAELRDCPAHHSPANLRRGGDWAVAKRLTGLRDMGIPFGSGGPVEGFVGGGEIGRAAGEGVWVEPVGGGQSVSDSRPLEAEVGIGWVERWPQCGSVANPRELLSCPRQEGSDKQGSGSGDACHRPHRRQAAHARSAIEAHHQCFRLIVPVVSGREGQERARGHPCGEGGVAGFAGTLLDRGGGRMIPAGFENSMGNAEAGTDRRDHARLFAAAFAKAVVDGRGLDAAGPRGGGKEQKGETVRPSGNGDAETRAAIDEWMQVGGEPLD